MAYLVHHLLEAAAAADPDRVAARHRGRSIAYGALARRADGVARTLADAGIGIGDRVAFAVPKSLDAVAAMYGTLKAGATCVPLNLQAPIAHLGAILEDTDPRALVVTPDRVSTILEVEGFRPRLVLVDGDRPDRPIGSTWSPIGAADLVATDVPEAPAIEDDVAFILFTSGSTGRPKGAMLSHRNVLHIAEHWWPEVFAAGPGHRQLNFTPLHFVPTLADVFGSAGVRGIVVLMPEEQAMFGAELVATLREERINGWVSLPSAFLQLLDVVTEPGLFPELRSIMYGGATFPPRQVRHLARLIPNARIWHAMGATESLVRTAFPVGDISEDDVSIPIGRSLRNVEVFALTDEGTVAGEGDEGEMYVRGPGVFKGYWHRPDLTSEVLVSHPTSPEKGVVHRTGDLVRLLPGGDMEFVGRRDQQVKSRGYRIELGEIEVALGAHPAVKESAVVAIPHDEWGTAIVAFVVARTGERLSEPDLKRRLMDRVPRYMIPALIEIRMELPRSASGKIDRLALASSMGAIVAAAEDVGTP
jgi:amino acid adenylation domain-containing protein